MPYLAIERGAPSPDPVVVTALSGEIEGLRSQYYDDDAVTDNAAAEDDLRAPFPDFDGPPPDVDGMVPCADDRVRVAIVKLPFCARHPHPIDCLDAQHDPSVIRLYDDP